MQASAATQCTIAMADVQVTVVCRDTRVIATVRQHYRPFVTTAPPAPDFVVQLIVVPDWQPAPDAPAEPTYDSDTTRLSGQTCAGAFDFAAGRGTLQAVPSSLLNDLDYALRVIYALLLFERGALLFHGAGMVRDGRGYVCFGASGSGKTTISRLSLGVPGVRILNDDLVVLTPTPTAPSGWQVLATPFSNPTQVAPSGPAHAPLTVLLQLAHAPAHIRTALSPATALAALTAGTPVISGMPQHAATLLRRAHAITTAVPCYRLGFRRDTAFWHLLKDG